MFAAKLAQRIIDPFVNTANAPPPGFEGIPSLTDAQLAVQIAAAMSLAKTGEILAGAALGGAGGSAAAAGRGPYLVRFGKGPESAETLAADAAKAEAHGFPHGVSTKQVGRISGSDKGHRAALKSDVEAYFRVQQTGRNPAHHTVHLPKPVTPEVADRFNGLFTPRE